MSTIWIKGRNYIVEESQDAVVSIIRSGASAASHNMICLTMSGKPWWFNAQAIDVVQP